MKRKEAINFADVEHLFERDMRRKDRYEEKDQCVVIPKVQ